MCLAPRDRMSHRMFTDALGLRWTVWDVPPCADANGMRVRGSHLCDEAAQGWLAFQCLRERRRFYMPPEGWETFTEPQLAILCHHAVRVLPAR